MNQSFRILVISFLALSVTGCVSFPEVSLSPTIQAEELSQHVHFLAQPALRGRKPLTQGSRRARRYIRERFTACGLVPWGDAESYAQSFGVGTNMIGVLPGADPNWADEVILVSAHYDHLGKSDEGLCLGASDNAAGVAALLEIAETLTLNAKAPRRTVCFAAFDQEESGLLGALSFSQRADFDGHRIAGVVNIDLLGRSGFEVLPEHLFVSGTAGYPLLRQKLHQADPHIRLLPVSEHLLGARSDHAAFADLEVCTLFFSCGPYRDYHKPGDIADRVNYEQTRASSHTILTAVAALANTSPQWEPEATAYFDPEEWRNIKFCLQQIEAKHDTLNADATLLIGAVEDLQGKQSLTHDDLRDLFMSHADALGALMIWPHDPCDPNLSDEEILNHFALGWRMGLLNLDYRAEILKTGQALAGHVSQYQKRIVWGIPDFEYERAILHDSYLHIEDANDNQLVLTVIPLFSSLSVKPPGILKWPPRFKTSFAIGASWKPKATQGTREELVDISLLGWGRAITEGEPNGYWGKILTRVAEAPAERRDDSWEQWLAWRLDAEDWADANEWTLAHMKSSNPYLAYTAIRSLPETPHRRFEPTLASLITDVNAHPSIRSSAIAKANEKSQTATLQALARTLHDTTDLEGLHLKLGENHPHGPLVDFIKTHRAKEMELWSKTKSFPKQRKTPPPPPKTVGEFALKHLRDITNKDYGPDQEAWLQWLAKHD